MSPRIALLFLVLGSAAASKKPSSDLGSMKRSCMTNNLLTAMALARLPPDEMSTDRRDQFRGRKTSPVVGEYKNILNVRNRFKVNPKWIKAAVQNKIQENNNRLNEGPLTELPSYWFKICINCPKHTWFIVSNKVLR